MRHLSPTHLLILRVIREKELFSAAASTTWPEAVFVTEKVKVFLTEKARQHAVQSKIFLPSLLACTSNAMNKSKLMFTEEWEVTQNLYWVIVAPPGTGKTPCMNIALGPLLKIEEVFYYLVFSCLPYHYPRRKWPVMTVIKRNESVPARGSLVIQLSRKMLLRVKIQVVIYWLFLLIIHSLFPYIRLWRWDWKAAQRYEEERETVPREIESGWQCYAAGSSCRASWWFWRRPSEEWRI